MGNGAPTYPRLRPGASRFGLTGVQLGLGLGLAALAACSAQGAGGTGAGGDLPSGGASGKADSWDEARGVLEPSTPIEDSFTDADETHVWTFAAPAGTTVAIEITQRGSSRGLDTTLQLFGPASGGGDPEELAADDEAGWGDLSEIERVELPRDGAYAAVVGVDPETGLDEAKRYRMVMTCFDGGCDEIGAPHPVGNDIRWVEGSLEYRASVAQTYRAAGARIAEMAEAGELEDAWGVALDVDETILSNVQYQRERAESGLGYSPWSWSDWVARHEATALPGAVAFLEDVRDRGGTVALVTNRWDGDCPDTRDNLERQGVPFDVLLCRTGSGDKSERWAMVQAGTAAEEVPAVELEMWIGDNAHDFPGTDQDTEDLSSFGRRHFVIPNPMYGSWD